MSRIIPVHLTPAIPMIRFAPRLSWLRTFLGHTDAGARTAAARLMGASVPGLQSKVGCL